MLNNLIFVLNWLPWLNFSLDRVLIQLVLFYLLSLLILTVNVYYILFYLLIFIFYVGLFLCVIQAELFTGFLWLAECTVIFTGLLLLFFLKPSGFWLVLEKQSFLSFGAVLVFLLTSFFSSTTNLLENKVYFFTHNYFSWEDFFEGLINTNSNDFTAFVAIMYTINGILLMIVGVLLLVGSIICVNLNRLLKVSRLQPVSFYLNIFNFFLNALDFSFIRQQNLFNQESQPTSSRVFKRKI